MRILTLTYLLALAIFAQAQKANLQPQNAEFQSQKIDRHAVVSRNNPKLTAIDTLGSLSVGNGHFATTVDITGLQSFPQKYENGVPLCAMSDWGWHSFPNTKGLKPSDTEKSMDLGHGHKEVYAVEYKTAGKNKDATEYFRVNPHRLNLGNLGLLFGKDSECTITDIKDVKQSLNLYDGNISSQYNVLSTPVDVTTAALADRSALITSVSTKLFRKGQARICFQLPYVTGKHADWATDFGNADKHTSKVVAKGGSYAIIEHTLDTTTYYAKLSWQGSAKFVANEASHCYVLQPTSDKISVKLEYAEKQADLMKSFNYVKELAGVTAFWNKWWNDGAIVDFSQCTDTRAKELERRTILSQYLTFINCAGNTPPQETGLTYNSWFGRPHLEMTWWHMVDFSLWNRPEVMERIMDWYTDVAYPYAKDIAKRQGFKGIRWMKMTDPWVGESPSNVGSFLTWQQPHYIYMAEELYRHAANADAPANDITPSAEQKKVLARYAKQVEETAEFLYDFAKSCANSAKAMGEGRGLYLFGQTAMQESMSKDFSYGHPFEQAYFVYGLTTAQTWRERQGLPRHQEWDMMIRHIAPLPATGDGIYTAGIPSQPFLDASETTGEGTFDPFNYGGETGKKQLTHDEFYLKCSSDHPAVLGACGLLPDYGLYDRAKMQRTLSWVMDNWNWPTTWGWDYGMTAMCAARLGDGENAIRALLIDKGKNTYLVSGHNYQEPKRLRLYLPGNGALLDAVAMMCAGWDGCPDIKNPGFPQNGKWNVRWEGLHKMQ